MMQRQRVAASFKTRQLKRDKLRKKLSIESHIYSLLVSEPSFRKVSQKVTEMLISCVTEYAKLYSAQKTVEGRIEICTLLERSLNDGQAGTSIAHHKVLDSILRKKQVEYNQLKTLKQENDLELTEEIILKILSIEKSPKE